MPSQYSYIKDLYTFSRLVADRRGNSFSKKWQVCCQLIRGRLYSVQRQDPIDDSGRQTGKVIETIGPVSAPYASVLPLVDRPKKAVGAKLFSGNAKHVKVTRRRNFGKKSMPSRKSNKAI